MKQEIKDLQNRAINELVEKTEEKNIITFRAPTGSGKTFMIAKYIDNILMKDKDVVFIISTLSKSELAGQNYEKFEEYKRNKYVKNIESYLISSEIFGEERLFIPTDYNVYHLPKDLYKKGSKLMQGPFEGFIQNLKEKKDRGGKEKKIYFIKDEYHIKTNNLDILSEKYFDKIIQLSATPKKGDIVDVMITDKEAEDVNLIKKIELGNKYDTLDDAINKFLEVRDKYLKQIDIHPCMIIQISNKEKADVELKNIVFPAIKKHSDLKWMLIVDNPKECDTNDTVKNTSVSNWKKHAKDNNAPIDIIIFKLAISEGWDIPRACMLYQIRDTDSEQLDEQVIGRVRRNPKLMNFEKLDSDDKELVSKCYIWGVLPKEHYEKVEVKLFDNKKVKKEIQIKTTRLKRDSFNKNVDDVIKILKNNKLNDKKHKLFNENLNIFDLYDRYVSAPVNIQELCDKYSTNVQKWINFNINIDEIITESKKYEIDYDKKMVLNIDENGQMIFETLPMESAYLKTDKDKKLEIDDWIWIKDGDKENDFYFDSEAETKWAKILKDSCSNDSEYSKKKETSRCVKRTYINDDIPNYLWAKNFLENSDIKYEYYNYGYQNSYPDFILKDSYGNIHIFEVKSLNKNKNNYIDEEEYIDKIVQLTKCYCVAAKKTGHIFYIPILHGNEWHILRYYKGNAEELSEEEFKKSLKNEKLAY